MVPLLDPPPDVPPPPQATVAKTATTGSASAWNLVNLIWFPLSRSLEIDANRASRLSPRPLPDGPSRSRSGRECAGEGRGHPSGRPTTPPQSVFGGPCGVKRTVERPFARSLYSGVYPLPSAGARALENPDRR